MKKVFPSKIGLELIIPISLILALGFKNILQQPQWNAILLLILVLAFISYTFTSIKYSIENTILTVKASFFVNEKIDINSITKITKSNNIISAPAASLDRIEIFYGNKNSILISPKNKIEFINVLTTINPKIEVLI